MPLIIFVNFASKLFWYNTTILTLLKIKHIVYNFKVLDLSLNVKIFVISTAIFKSLKNQQKYNAKYFEATEKIWVLCPTYRSNT